jgi:uncharacterized repeat protein (TIGR01451 family)
MTTIGRGIRRALLSLALLSLAFPAWAKPLVEVSMSQAREVTEATGGATAVKLVPAQTAAPGDVVQYTLAYRNQGDAVARDARIVDPVPAGTTFLSAATGGDGVTVSYSADGGKTFAPAERLTREVRLPSGALEQRPIPPAEYTHVRWTVAQLPPGGGGLVSLRVRVN